MRRYSTEDAVFPGHVVGLGGSGPNGGRRSTYSVPPAETQ